MSDEETKTAVALSYGENPVPLIVAKGRSYIATEIMEEASRQGVPIMQDAMLAERLARLPVDTPIPREVYVAVAVILSWVYWMQGRSPLENHPAEDQV